MKYMKTPPTATSMCILKVYNSKLFQMLVNIHTITDYVHLSNFHFII